MKTIPTEFRNLCMAEAIELMGRDDQSKSARHARWARRKKKGAR